MLNRWPFYSRLVARQWRLPSLRLFCLAVAISCAVSHSISLLGDRVERLLERQSRDVLAADLVLRSSVPLNDQQEQLVRSSGLRRADVLLLRSMAMRGDNGILASVKAVSPEYPLRGTLRTARQLYGDAMPEASGPPPGEIWVEDRILHSLGAALGDSINIGISALPVTRVLVYEPDRGNSFYSFTPRVMMHLDDIAATGVVQPGSRLSYNTLLAGPEPALNQLRQSLALSRQQRFVEVEDRSAALAETMERARRFLAICTLVALLLGAVAAALASYDYGRQSLMTAALLRCLGLRRGGLAAALCLPFASAMLAALALGWTLGWAVQMLIVAALAGLLPQGLPQAGPLPFVASAMGVLLVGVCFAGPFIWRLLRAAPGQLLRQNPEPQSILILGAVLMGSGLGALVWLATGELRAALYTWLGLVALVFLVAALGFALLHITSALSNRTGSLVARIAGRLVRHNPLLQLQVLALALVFFALALMYSLQSDLVDSWQDRVPADAPNFFAINLGDADVEPFAAVLERNAIPHSPLYPIVRGRPSQVNGETIEDYVSKDARRDHESLRRDLSLTWSWQLPKGNRITAGAWHSPGAPPGISVEQELAENLGWQLGDELGFIINTQTLRATITSIRSVDWESFTPNFYIIFTPGMMDGLPATHLASLRLEQRQRTLIADMVRQFPSATFFDVAFLLERIRAIIGQLGSAVSILMYGALLAGVLVFVVVEAICQGQRRQMSALCRAMGARAAWVRRIYRWQFVGIGLLAGALGYLINTLVGIFASWWILETPWIFNPTTALLCLTVPPLLCLATGTIALKRGGHTPLTTLLRAPA